MAASDSRPVAGGGLRLQILGPLRLWRDRQELDPGPRQQAYLLALLIASAGAPISTNELAEMIWGPHAPASALNIIQKYISGLRRLLEPGLSPRDTGSYLLRRGAGYLFVADSAELNLVAFRGFTAAARTALAGQRSDEALDLYARGLSLWYGRAGDGLRLGTAAVPTFAALDDEFLNASAAAADLAITLGQARRVTQHVQLAAAMAPIHEPVHAALITTLAASGQQAEALSAYRAIRARLADELGKDPGAALQDAHQRVLHQSLATSAPADAVAEPQATPPGRPSSPAAAAVVPVMLPHAPRTHVGSGPRSFWRRESAQLVGRAEEFATLWQAVELGLAGGTGLAVVEGEPGVGKTRLLEKAAADADQRGAHVVWGNCLEGDGTPSMWPWVQVIDAVLNLLPASGREKWLRGELGGLFKARDEVLAGPIVSQGAIQFRLFERVVGVLSEVAAQGPMAVFIDDLQWADIASLHLFAHLVTRLPPGTVLVGALRTRAPLPGSELTRMLAGASRVPGHRRILLGPLDRAQVAELIRRETGQRPDDRAVRSIYGRTEGNPFFVRELSRLYAETGVLAEDAVAQAGVPTTVRDVVRDRMAGLDDRAHGLLQIAALAGREVDLGLLARIAELDIDTCLLRLEPVEALGLIGPTPGNPSSVRFAHDLVRESVAGLTPRPQAPRLHLRVADALEQADRADDSVTERIAHHLWAAGPLADPARTAASLIRAGRRAAVKFALEASQRQLQRAVEVARRAGLAELELAALSELVSAVRARAGFVGSPPDMLERAEYLARNLGHEREAADFLLSRCVAAFQGLQVERGGALARQQSEEVADSTDPAVRAYGPRVLGLHNWQAGNIGESLRCLSHAERICPDDMVPRKEHPLRRDLQVSVAVISALVTGLGGDLGAARASFDRIEAAIGDNPHEIILWATFASKTAAMAGDPEWVLRVAERGFAAESGPQIVFLGHYLRMNWCWARAVSGDDPAGAAAEAERIAEAVLLQPRRSGLAAWFGLVAEAWLAAGRPARAAALLDVAESAVAADGERYAEGLILLLRARLSRMRGEPADVVRNAAERARALSVERGALLFARRAEQLVAGT